MEIRLPREARVIGLLLVVGVTSRAAGPQTIEFNRDIRPILSDRCFTCHGPDKNNRLTPLRFDNENGSL